MIELFDLDGAIFINYLISKQTTGEHWFDDDSENIQSRTNLSPYKQKEIIKKILKYENNSFFKSKNLKKEFVVERLVNKELCKTEKHHKYCFKFNPEYLLENILYSCGRLCQIKYV